MRGSRRYVQWPRSRVVRGLVAAWCVGALAACGGHVEVGADRVPASSRSGPDATSTRCESAPRALHPELVWRTGMGPLNGVRGPGLFQFSADGTKLVVPTDEYVLLGYGTYDAADGTVLFRTELPLVDRDAAWERELRSPWDSVKTTDVVDLAHETVLLSLADRPLAARVSADGRYVIALYCGANTRLERREIAGGGIVSLPMSDDLTTCGSGVYYPYDSTPLVTDASGTDVVFPAKDAGRITIASFGSETANVYSVFEPSIPPTSSDEILSIAISPKRRLLAVSTVKGTLSIRSYPDLAPALPEIAGGVTTAFTNCYCTERRFAPLVWSPDERWFATVDESRDISVRRTCDGISLATISLPGPAAATPKNDVGPAYLAASPDGSGLAALVTDHSFGSDIEYYRLSE